MADVVVPVFGRGDLLRRLMPALEGHDVILVDDASPDDGTREIVRGHAEHGTRAVFHDHNLGFPASVNDGAVLVRGDRFFLLNTDVVPQPGWAGLMNRALDADPRTGAVGALILSPDGLMVQHAGVDFRDDGLPVHLYRFFTRHSPEVNTPRELSMVTYAAVLLRTSAFRGIGMLDTEFGFGMYDDCDAGLRMREMGWACVYQPAAVFLHDESASFTARSDDLEIRMAGKEHFIEKWVESGRWKDLRVNREIAPW
jgi:GT2 family glycosyltransferase